MSGFATDWLDLREPADHAARAPALLAAAGALLAAVPRPLVVDLGCGTGSTLRAFAGRPAVPVRWRLVDDDPALLDAARPRLPAAEVEFVRGDLRDIDALPLDGAHLATASALFDLVSQDWLRRLASRLREGGTAVYAALNYDGRMEFAEPHEEDEGVVAAFDRHQKSDKGFGPALGPDSGPALVETLAAAGFEVEAADSPWHLSAGALKDETIRGVAQAVSETGLVSPAALASWRAFHLASAQGCIVGHRDVFARPDP